MPVGAAGSASFVPNDPLAPKQWYLSQIHAFDSWAELPETLSTVRVAIIDSGLDIEHPEFAGRVAGSQSFVGGDVLDRQGHGTFVAGIIAAAIDNGAGIAGIAFPAQLLIAKVVRSDGSISPYAEAKAIRWAVDNGARVINLSLGGLHDPLHPRQDAYSRVEQDAIEYAYGEGAVVVAAVGNGDQAPRTPWNYASYPAALPHVIGVSALTQEDTVPSFSNRDAHYNDMAAPGVGIVSTLPRSLTASRPACADQGYSICGPPEFKSAEGTSYAAAQVSAAAALLLASRPTLAPDQVSYLLERSASDVKPAFRDAYSGWGELDITAALAALDGQLPAPDRHEGNDDAGSRSFALYGRSISVSATVDFWDDPIDVYKIRLRKGQTVSVSLRGPSGTDTDLILWRPGTQVVEGLSARVQTQRVVQSARAGPNEHFVQRVARTGWYYVEVKLTSPGSGPYKLHISKSRP